MMLAGLNDGGFFDVRDRHREGAGGRQPHHVGGQPFHQSAALGEDRAGRQSLCAGRGGTVVVGGRHAVGKRGGALAGVGIAGDVGRTGNDGPFVIGDCYGKDAVDHSTCHIGNQPFHRSAARWESRIAGRPLWTGKGGDAIVR